MRLLLALTFLFAVSAADDELNDRPIIAILAQIRYHQTQSYIAASYVKYLESSGARVVPVPANITDSELEVIFKGVNGVLFPGGGVRMLTSPYYKHAKYFFDAAIAANKAGDHFPIWGTCLGFETLNVIASGGKPQVLSSFSAEDISIPLNYTDAAESSRLFQGMPPDLHDAIGNKDITYNHHKSGVSPNVYDTETSLSKFFQILSLNNDLKGNTFISTIEAYDYPIYGTQWHPEKNNFEFNTNENLPHSIQAVKTSQYMSNFFVNEARKNQHKFDSKEIEQKHLIYNYAPEYTGLTGNFEQSYFFD